MTEESKPRKVFVGYDTIGGVKVKRWRYEGLKPRPILRTPDLFQERTWSVRREEERYLFEFWAARQGGGTDIYEISKEDFDGVLSGKLVLEDLARKYCR